MDRFWDKVTVRDDNECWIWTAGTTRRGYGHFRLNGKMEGAHRISWAMHNGSWPEDLYVLHSCDNPPCVNPWHLRIGTHDDNMKDKVRRGRQARNWGSTNWQSFKTHCPRGHPYSGSNLYVRPDGTGRGCKFCIQSRGKSSKA